MSCDCLSFTQLNTNQFNLPRDHVSSLKDLNKLTYCYILNTILRIYIYLSYLSKLLWNVTTNELLSLFMTQQKQEPNAHSRMLSRWQLGSRSPPFSFERWSSARSGPDNLMICCCSYIKSKRASHSTWSVIICDHSKSSAIVDWPALSESFRSSCTALYSQHRGHGISFHKSVYIFLMQNALRINIWQMNKKCELIIKEKIL